MRFSVHINDKNITSAVFCGILAKFGKTLAGKKRVGNKYSMMAELASSLHT